MKEIRMVGFHQVTMVKPGDNKPETHTLRFVDPGSTLCTDVVLTVGRSTVMYAPIVRHWIGQEAVWRHSGVFGITHFELIVGSLPVAPTIQEVSRVFGKTR